MKRLINNDKMRIDLIISSLTGGGAERVVSNLANYFAGQGHQVRVITFAKSKDTYPLNENIERIKYEKDFIIFNIITFKCLIFLLKFYFIKKNRPDIISSHMALMGYATIPIAKLYKIKLIVTEHINHLIGKDRFVNKFLWNYLYPHASAVTALTKFDLPFFKTKNKNACVIHNSSSYKPLKNIDTNREKIILAVGNLDRYHHKGFDNLLDIAQEVLPKYPDWKLKLVGGGELGLAFLNDKVEKLNLNGQVIFTGFRSDVKELMQHSEILILSSRFEGLPMVLIEALSQGMVCVSYDCISGPSEIITTGKNGLLAEDQNKEDMMLKLESLIKDKELRASLRKNTISSLNKFSPEEVGLKWEKLITALLK